MTMLVLGSGCAGLRVPAIDPSGQSVFVPGSSTQLTSPFAFPEAVFPPAPATPEVGTCNPPQPYGWSPYGTAAADPEPRGCFAGLCDLFPGFSDSGTVGGIGPPPVAPPDPLIPLAGNVPLAQPAIPPPIGSNNFRVGSGSRRSGYEGTFTLTPRTLIAPVGSTVVLRAGICDEDGFLVMRQPIEWSLSEDSAGSIVDVDQTAKPLWRQWLHKPPKKNSGQYAIGLTSTKPQWLNQGTDDPCDDIWLVRGQTWVSVTSASEGSTHVTAVAPSVNGWGERQETSTIHWVDAQWTLPPATVSGYGGHTLVTGVSRSSGEPVPGWTVRYEVIGGTPAALDANGAQAVEVPTDVAGNAIVAIVPQGSGQGTTNIAVRVYRPGSGGAGRTLIGQGTTSVTWTDQPGTGPLTPGPLTPGPTMPVPSLPPSTPLPPIEPQTPPPGGQPGITMDVRGPVFAEVGAEVEYQFLVTNTGGVAVNNVEIVNEFPEGLQYLNSSPAGNEQGDRVRWQLGALQPGQTRSVSALYRAARAGLVRNCGGAIADGAVSDDCATTDVQGRALSIQVQGPNTARVGEELEYEVLLRNESNQPLANVKLFAGFDPGLGHASVDPQLADRIGSGAVDKILGTLDPNQTSRLPLIFTARRAGQSCFQVRATSAQSGQATDQICVDIRDDGTAPPPGGGSGGFDQPPPTQPPTGPFIPADPGPQDPGPLQPGPAPPGPTLPPATPSVSIRKTGPTRARVGDVIDYFITVTTGNLPATDFRVFDEFDLNLEPVRATPGPGGEPFERDGNRLFWQIAYMPAGRSETYRIQFECLVEGARVCNRAFVVDDRGMEQSDQQCLEIVPGDRTGFNRGAGTSGFGGLTPGGPTAAMNQPTLGVDVRRLGPSLQGNGLVEYVVDVTNRANQDDYNVALSIQTPTGTRFADSTNPPRVETLNISPDGRQVDFLPVSTLRSGETTTFRVLVRQDAANVGRFTAQVKSDLNQTPIISEDRI